MGRPHREWVAGTMLLFVGLLLLGGRLFPDLVPVLPLLIGLGLLGLFFLTRSESSLVAGSVIVGVGIGVLVVRGTGPNVGGGGFMISLGAGFLLCWVLGLIFDIRPVRVWPLVPGLVLLVIGAVVYSANAGASLLDAALDWWPLLLMLMGAYLLFHARLRRTEVEDVTTAVPVVHAAQDHAPAHHPSSGHGDEPEPILHEDSEPTESEHGDQSESTPAVAGDEVKIAPAGYAIRPSTHSLADATGGTVGGDRPGSVESL